MFDGVRPTAGRLSPVGLDAGTAPLPWLRTTLKRIYLDTKSI